MLVVILGVAFLVNLECKPLSIPPDAPQDALFAFWLGEKTKKGVIAPCVAPCTHGGETMPAEESKDASAEQENHE